MVTYPWPPVFGGAPVSPAPMARRVVEKAREEMGAARAREGILVRDWRNILICSEGTSC